jgi:hypothetical protein
MATVRFSKDLTDDILKNAEAKMAPLLEKALASRPPQDWSDRIYDVLFGEYRPVLTQLPAWWVGTQKEITIERIGSMSVSLDFTFSQPMPWPIAMPSTPLARKASYYRANELILTDHEAWKELADEVVAYKQRLAAARNQVNEFKTMVKQVIEAYATLAPALKAWPPLWELIPENVKEKHRQVVEREKKDVKLEVDINKLTAMSVAARLGAL